MRHRRPDGSVWVRTYPLTLPRDHTEPRHAHEWDQLTYAASGVIEIDTDEGVWVVPPHRAVWVPAGVAHGERMYAPVSVRMLYFAEGIAHSLPRECRMVNVSSLLRERPDHAASLAALAREVGASRRTIERSFVRDTHMTAGEWRRRARLLHAVRRLAEGEAVTNVALEAGYSSVSAFIAVFKKTFGMTPARSVARGASLPA